MIYFSLTKIRHLLISGFHSVDFKQIEQGKEMDLKAKPLLCRLRKMLTLFLIASSTNNALFVKALERFTNGDTFRNPSANCTVSGCNNFESREIGGHCTSNCCTCKCSEGLGATFVEHRKQCVRYTELFDVLTIGAQGKSYL